MGKQHLCSTASISGARSAGLSLLSTHVSGGHTGSFILINLPVSPNSHHLHLMSIYELELFSWPLYTLQPIRIRYAMICYEC